MGGTERPLRRADYAFRAVKLDPGEQQVRFAFQPRLWPAGLGISLAFLAGMVVAMVWASGMGRRRRQERR